METDTATPANKPKAAKLRWFQFSLRTLLLFVTLCAVLCSWFAVRMERARKQRAAVEAIQKLGGTVRYAPRGPEWLRKLLGDDFYRNVDTVSFEKAPQVTDAGLEHLQGLTQLSYLWLANTQVTDAGLEHLKGFTQLRRLVFFQTQVTVEGVRKLRQALPKCDIYR